ncbi:hypothetical protein ACXOVL_01185 [Streptococcus thermophilus]
MKKILNWIWSNKQTLEVEVPKWTSWEENERKYEARQAYERQQVAKMRAENKQY